MLTVLTLVSFLAYLPQVCAHGYVAQVTIDGTAYSGNVPNAEPTPSIVRQINNIAPVKGASNTYLNCGQDAQKAALVADANPGSQLQFLWLDGDGTNVSLISCLGEEPARSELSRAVATQHRSYHDVHGTVHKYYMRPVRPYQCRMVQDRGDGP